MVPARTGSPRLLPLLRSATQAGLLEALILHPDHGRTVVELAERLSVTPMAVRRELTRLVDAGIVEREAIGRQGLYHACADSPLYQPLRELIERSVGVEALLRELLEGVEGVEGALIYGSWAEAEIDAGSDVDVLVVGDVEAGEMASELLELQARTGREINVLTMTPDELRARRDRGDGFLRDVLASPTKPLVGRLPVS